MKDKNQVAIDTQGVSEPIKESTAEKELVSDTIMAKEETLAVDNTEDAIIVANEESTAETDLLDEEKSYNVEVIENSAHLKIGETYKVSGNIAKNLLKKGLIKLI